jgi:hypothetical protein
MDGEFILYLVVPIIGGLVMYWVISSLVKTPGRSLALKFASLGTLKGKTKEEIINVTGLPNSVSAMPNGTQLLQWMATGYHISLMFESNDNCLGVSHEFSQVSSPTTATTASEQPSLAPTEKSPIASIVQQLPPSLKVKFCDTCGAPRVKASARFCGQCGTHFPE